MLLRRFTPCDWQDLYEYLSDEKVVEFEPYPAYSKEQAVAEAKRRAENNSFWAVCLKENGKLIGNLYFNQQAPDEFMTWELGYVFNRKYHGNGYATEGALRLLQYGFEECLAHRIVARCSPLNIDSWKLLERLHMRREGCFKQKLFFKRNEHGEPIWLDEYEYAMLSHEWFSPTKI